MKDFDDFLSTLRRLRAPDGCEWDRAQTFETMKPYLLEEAHEVIDAVDADNARGLKEELGDLACQLFTFALIAEEKGLFKLEDSLRTINEKLVRRHPHVFAGAKAGSQEEILKAWERIKDDEKGGRRALLEGIPKSMPALTRAFKIQDRARRVGFDWENPEGVIEKIREECKELEIEIKKNEKAATTLELGDLLFSVVNLARHLKIDPESALRRTTEKWANRFAQMEKILEERDLTLQKATMPQMDEAWEEAKRRGPDP